MRTALERIMRSALIGEFALPAASFDPSDAIIMRCLCGTPFWRMRFAVAPAASPWCA